MSPLVVARTRRNAWLPAPMSTFYAQAVMNQQLANLLTGGRPVSLSTLLGWSRNPEALAVFGAAKAQALQQASAQGMPPWMAYGVGSSAEFYGNWSKANPDSPVALNSSAAGLIRVGGQTMQLSVNVAQLGRAVESLPSLFKGSGPGGAALVVKTLEQVSDPTVRQILSQA
jgi:hypothetical protein